MVEEPLPEGLAVAIERNALQNASKHDGRADPGAVAGRILGEFPELRTRAAEVMQSVKDAVAKVNALPKSRQLELLAERFPESVQRRGKEERKELDPLPGAVKGKAVFRLPPEPSGFMTIGHAMAFTVNYLYREMYDGELWLRFEDTNPRKVAKRYYESFRDGVRWLGIEVDHEKCISQDMDLMYATGARLLTEGKGYVCSCDADRVKKLRFEGVECEHRGVDEAHNLALWEEMLGRKHKEGSLVVRFKGDMKSVDYSLRDPNVFRIIDHPHPLTGTKYVVWPTYNLANTIEDQHCGVTHVLRSSEFPNELQDLLREALGFRGVTVVQFSRYNFKGTPVAKRRLRPLVEEKLVSGWDDPRMPTVAGVRRRGIVPGAIRQFTLQVGYTRSEHEYDWSLLFAVNRKLLDPTTRRLFFVPDPLRLRVEGAPQREVLLKYHPDADLGERKVATGEEFFVPAADLASIGPGATFRLMDLFNVELVATGREAVGRYSGDELAQDVKKVQWVTPDHHELKVLVPGELFQEDGTFNSDSLREVSGYAEESFSTVADGEIVQFPRFGFCRLDSPGGCIFAHK